MTDMKGIIEKYVGEHNDILKSLMTARELLELAAKAAGFEVKWDVTLPDGTLKGVDIVSDGEVIHYWNPLEDDGDALRLAVKLGIDIEQSVPQDQSMWVCSSVWGSGSEGCTEPFDDEAQRLASTRRAIVRTAAEIGRNMAD